MKLFLAISSLFLTSAVNANGGTECTRIPQAELPDNSYETTNFQCAQCHVDELYDDWPCDVSPRLCQGRCWFVGEPLPPHPHSSEIEGCAPIKQARLESGSETTTGNCNLCANDYQWWPCDQDPPLCEGMNCVGDIFDAINAEGPGGSGGSATTNANGGTECTRIPQAELPTNSWQTTNSQCAQCHVDSLYEYWPCDVSPRLCQGNCWFVGEPLPPYPHSSEVEGCVPIKNARIPPEQPLHEPVPSDCNRCLEPYEWYPCNLDPPICEGMHCVGDIFDAINAEGPGGSGGSAATAICTASAWGDPHIVTFDGLKYDAQPKGEAIFLTSDEPKLEIQARFEKATRGRNDPAVTTGIVIDGPEGSPRIQVTIAQPEFVTGALFGPKQDGFCLNSDGEDQNSGVSKLDDIDYYEDDSDLHQKCLEMCSLTPGVTGCEMIWDKDNRGCYAHTQNVDGGGNYAQLHSCYLVKQDAVMNECSGYQEIPAGGKQCPVEMMIDGEQADTLTYENALATVEQNGRRITIEYPDVVKVTMKLSVFGRCFFSVDVELYDCASYTNSAIGLLGSPNGSSRDDWMTPSGVVLDLPSGGVSNFFFAPAFNYVKNNWIITNSADSIFSYGTCASFDTHSDSGQEYDPTIENIVNDLDPEIGAICGDDMQCMIDGRTLGEQAAEEFNENPATQRDVVDPDEWPEEPAQEPAQEPDEPEEPAQEPDEPEQHTPGQGIMWQIKLGTISQMQSLKAGRSRV